MTKETRAGYMATSTLEEECRDYIRKSTVNGKYTGDVHYLHVYENLVKYNKKEN